jgi:hypothetical protein
LDAFLVFLTSRGRFGEITEDEKEQREQEKEPTSPLHYHQQGQFREALTRAFYEYEEIRQAYTYGIYDGVKMAVDLFELSKGVFRN